MKLSKPTAAAISAALAAGERPDEDLVTLPSMPGEREWFYAIRMDERLDRRVADLLEHMIEAVQDGARYNELDPLDVSHGANATARAQRMFDFYIDECPTVEEVEYRIEREVVPRFASWLTAQRCFITASEQDITLAEMILETFGDGQTWASDEGSLCDVCRLLSRHVDDAEDVDVSGERTYELVDGSGVYTNAAWWDTEKPEAVEAA